MAHLAGVLTFCIAAGLFHVFSGEDTVEPEISCNKQIVCEEESLTCECRANTSPSNPSPNPSPVLSWPGHSSTSLLTVDSVTRHDNGTVFTCLMQREGLENVSATHTLLVACGPLQDEPKIKCHDCPLANDGTKNLTLTCDANHTYPTPYYSWGGLCASNTNSCTCRPRLDQNGGRVFCTATNRITRQHKTASYTVDFSYPPSEAPRIVADRNTTVSLGDILNCTVIGGRPLVDSVHLNCTKPTRPDQSNRVGSNSVSTSVIVNTSEGSETPFICQCSAVWLPESDLYQKITSHNFFLEHPPPKDPTIVANTTETELSSGDILTCTVHGGKPLVASVNFRCTNPTLSDQPDQFRENSVSSAIIVNTTEAGETAMVCWCSAVWGPKPDLYQRSNSKKFQLDFKATVTNFTVNETTKLRVTEDEEPDVVFCCDTAARPTADVSLLDGKKTLLAVSKATNGAGLNHSRTMYKLPSVRCEDTGVFVCEADNGLSTPSKKSVYLDVLGRPRLYTITNDTDQTPELTGKGIVITLVANPVPDAFHCGYLSLETGELDDCHPDIEFKAGCEQQTSMTFLATCSVHPVNVPEKYLGFYSLSISNGLGSYTLSFEVRQAVRLPNKQDPWMDGEFRTYAVFLSGLMGVTLLVVVTVVIVSLSAGWTCRTTTADSSGTAGVEVGKENAGYMSEARATQPAVCQPTEYQVMSFTNSKTAEHGDSQPTRNHATSCTENKTSETGDSQPKTTSFTENTTAVLEDAQQTRSHVTSFTENKKPEMVDSPPTRKEAMPFTDILRLNRKYEAKCGEELCDEVPDGVF